MKSLVIGVGNSLRGDDAAGPEVARAVAALGLPGVEVVEQAEPTRLIDLWQGRQRVVIVDAVRAGGPTGLVRVVGGEQADLFAGAGSGDTHTFGLAAAVQLARSLGRLPTQLTVVGIEAAGDRFGAPLSDPVRTNLSVAVDAVVAALK